MQTESARIYVKSTKKANVNNHFENRKVSHRTTGCFDDRFTNKDDRYGIFGRMKGRL